MAEDGIARPLPIAGAVMLTMLEIVLFTFGMRPPAPPSEPTLIAVRLVTRPAPSPAPVPNDAMPTIETEAPPLQLPRAPTVVPPDAMPTIETTAPPPPPAIVPSQPVPPLPMMIAPPSPLPAPPAAKPPPPRRTASWPAAGRAASLQAAPSSPAAAPESAPPHSAVSPGGGTMGARAIYRPMPEIPDELRRHPAALVAVARFHVAADGAATAELIMPTPDPRLNAALLATLARWRFFPALANGRPVASIIDIRIPIAVR